MRAPVSSAPPSSPAACPATARSPTPMRFRAPPKRRWNRRARARGLAARAAGELERLANHLGDIGAICNDASFALMHAHCACCANACCAPPMPLSAIASCATDRARRRRPATSTMAGESAIQAALGQIRLRFPALVELYDNTASLQDRTVDTGMLKPALARQFGAGGYVGRASGRAFDARRTLAYPPYDSLRFDVPVLARATSMRGSGSACARSSRALSLIDQILDGLPEGAIGTRCRKPARSARRHGDRRRISRRHSGLAAPARWPDRALSLTRSLLVSVAAAGGRHRRTTSLRISRSAISRSIVPIRASDL